MKVILVLLTFAIAKNDSVSVRRDDKWPPPMLKSFMKTMHESCVGSTGVTEAAITRFSDVEMFDNDEKLKCYMSCVFQEVGVTDDDGFLHMEKLVGAVGLLDDEAEMIFLKMAKRCLRPIISTHCETAFWYNKCWKTTDPVHYFLL